MLTRISSILVALYLFTSARESLAKELLFHAEPADDNFVNGADKKLGEAYRKEFKPRMFPNQTWNQRLSYSSDKPDVDETIEIYSKPDGSRWLSHRRANPSLTRVIWRRVVYNGKFNLHKELDAVPVMAHDVALPPNVAKELEFLWQTMLPGVAYIPEPRTLAVHAPTFDAWVRKDHSVKAGRVSMAAYDTPVYREFVDVIKDLRDVCDRGAKPRDPVFVRLLDKIRHLRAQLNGNGSEKKAAPAK